ncbi:MAG: hypothetical protein A2096_01640 [Spirochaetes bacterium GWF1_41_5]|nr:MAG: hypothetical protein A2096_01640 [Spirochaetes bacterium GWF1_41_5]
MPKTLLVVEDSTSVRNLIKYSLEPEGYDILAAENGKDAMEILENRPVDMVITDLQMPIMGGFELIVEMKKREIEIPVIVITAYNNTQMAMDSVKEGVYKLIEKPINFTVLVNAIKEKIG